MGQECGEGTDDKNDRQGAEGQHKSRARIGFGERQFSAAQIAENKAGAGARCSFQGRHRTANGCHALCDHR